MTQLNIVTQHSTTTILYDYFGANLKVKKELDVGLK